MREQFIHINEYGHKFYYRDREMTKPHREDGPAVEYADGDKAWYRDGKIHREDGPAIEYEDGDKAWYRDGKIHREDGPAVEYVNGDKSWYRDGKIHREDGPAIERVDGHKSWYLAGVYFTEAQFDARMNPIELTLEEIAEKFGVSVDRIKVKK